MLRVAIPGGVWRGEALRADAPVDTPAEIPVRELALRPIDGGDELFLLDTIGHPVPCARATALLARCLEDSDAERTARGLTVGDREALLLQLRRLTLGDSFDCVLRCPTASCGERMELTLQVSELLLPQYTDVRREYTLVLDQADGHYDISFRLPTADDLERAAVATRVDVECGALSLLSDCVRAVTRDGEHLAVAQTGQPVRAAISVAMAEHDPQAEIELDLVCPTCATAFPVVFDTGMFLLQELDQRAGQLTQDVHTLAMYYHWSEEEIVRLPQGRRARYLELIADAAARTRAL